MFESSAIVFSLVWALGLVISSVVGGLMIAGLANALTALFSVFE